MTGTNFNTIKINRSAAATVDPVIFAGTDTGLFKATVATPPTVTAFSIPATSRSLTVGITTHCPPIAGEVETPTGEHYWIDR